MNVIIAKAMSTHMWAVRWNLGVFGLSHSGCHVRRWEPEKMSPVLGIWKALLGRECSVFPI